MPTKDSKVVSLRIRNALYNQAKIKADAEHITVHAWALKLIESAIRGENSNV